MGQEAICTAHFGAKTSRGKAHLESEELIFRGDFRIAIPFRRIRSLRVRNGKLSIRVPEGEASFSLGSHAEKWAEKIKNPKTLLDKLGVKAESKVVVLGVRDRAFLKQLRARLATPPATRLVAGADIIFFGVAGREELPQLSRVKKALLPVGAIWVIRPKGTPAIKDVDVIAAGKAAGLVDVKVAAFSSTHTAEKLVIPLAER
ncbi:MAG: DUF3052 domain-containing protein [Acidobacteria bacterium]|nr:DUF3052 domain-containing protein [Acidobacteriota bacterium]